MKIKFDKFEVYYDDKTGIIDYIENIKTKKRMMMEIYLSGNSYDIKNEKTIMGNLDICDARYVRVMDFNIFIPRHIFILNKEDKL